MIKNFSKMERVDITDIKPEGWLRDFLTNQASGLTGHLEVGGYPYGVCSWDTPNSKKEKERFPRWWPYEQTAYWIDGMERCAELLGDGELLEKANKSLQYVLAHPGENGFLGPEFMQSTEMPNIRWSLAVFFRAFMAKYSATKDESIIEKLTAHYLGDDYEYAKERDVINVEIMLWLYLETGNKKLLERAEAAYYNYNYEGQTLGLRIESTKTAHKPYEHGVSYNEFFKLGAILYICTGKKKYLDPTLRAYKKIDKYFMLVDGLFCSEEYTEGNHYFNAHETCNIADYTWTLYYILMATGNAEWADKIERCIFNAGIGSVTEDFKGLQYFSCPNQVIATNNSNHCTECRGSKAMSYRPMPYTACCAGNVNRFFPNYCAHMWMKIDEDIFAVLYGANTLKYGDVTVNEKTNYPFDDSIAFEFSVKNSKKFNFYVRIPAWCKNAQIKLNGKDIDFETQNGFAKVNAEILDGDTLLLYLPSEICVKDYQGEGNFVEKGPLVYAYGMYGDRQIDTTDVNSTEDFPAYNIYPDKKWNYSICTENLDEYKFEKTEIKGNVWDIRNVPFKIKAPAVEVNDWDLERRTTIVSGASGKWFYSKDGDFAFTPHFPTKNSALKHGYGKKEEITLVPLAAAKLRLTIFPKQYKKL